MKRKFFNLAPLKIPSSKSDNKALKDALAAKQLSPPLSPITDRRILDPDVEAQLRVVCAAIVANYKPSDHVFETDTHTDFDAFQRSTREKRSYSHNNTHHPALAAPPLQSQRRLHEIQQLAAEQLAGPHPSKYSYKPDASLHDLFTESDSTHPAVQANISRRRDGLNTQTVPTEVKLPVRTSSTNARSASGQYLRAHSLDSRPRTAPAPESVDESYSTPLSASTIDYQYNYASTALTSVAITPSRTSKRTSQQNVAVDQTAVSRADAAAAEWMRDELERRRLQAYGMERGRTRQPPPSRASNSRIASRASSRGRSITAGISEYFRPSSRQGLSRSSSRGSMRPSSRDSDAEPERPSSSHGWRSWGFQRKNSSRSNSSRSNSRAGSLRGRSETRGREETKKELNLNRELPPLPSLDQYKEGKPQGGGTHIAALMRPKNRSRNTKRTSEKRDTPQRSVTAEQRKPITRIDSSDPAQSPSMRSKGKSSMHSKSSSHDFPLPLTPPAPPTMSADPALTIVELAPSVEEARRRHQGHVREKSSTDAVNFSRKLSMEGKGRPFDAQYPNVLDVTALPDAPTGQKDSLGFKKIFSGLKSGGKKDRKQMTWMERIEAEGIRGGILVEAAGAPTVRY